jgi:hypothetical protein
MENKAAERALPDDLPEWKHLDRGAREWALRHYRRPPGMDPSSPLVEGGNEFDDQAIGLVYSARGGDMATVFYLSGNEQIEQIATKAWRDSFGDPGVKVRLQEPGVVRIDYPVRIRQSFSNFYFRLIALLGHGVII